MLYVENKQHTVTEAIDSPCYWMGKLVLGTDVLERGMSFERIEQVVGEQAQKLLDENPTYQDVQHIVLEANPETDLLEISMAMESEDEYALPFAMSMLSLSALMSAGIDLHQVDLKGGRLVCGEKFFSDANVDPSASIDDLPYKADNELDRIFGELSENLAGPTPPL